MSSGPHCSVTGNPQPSMRSTAVRRLAGQCWMGPSGVEPQSCAAMRCAIWVELGGHTVCVSDSFSSVGIYGAQSGSERTTDDNELYGRSCGPGFCPGVFACGAEKTWIPFSRRRKSASKEILRTGVRSVHELQDSGYTLGFPHNDRDRNAGTDGGAVLRDYARTCISCGPDESRDADRRHKPAGNGEEAAGGDREAA